MPESGTPAAIGYAEASGIPYGMGLVKNSYVGRTFIQPSQTIRQLGIRLKLNPLRDVIEGKRLVVVDDSIVRGNTQRALVRMLREAGAREVHVRISSPPVKWPCFYGIDFATRAELIANGLSTDEICASIGADSLGLHLPRGARRGHHACPADDLCRACFDGVYPVKLPEPEFLGKHLLEMAPAARRRRPGHRRWPAAAPPTRSTAHELTTGPTYEAAGVSIEAGDRAVELMKVWVEKARRPEMIGSIGGFAGLFDASALKAYDRPLLASSADGVGTKVAIAQALDKHDTIGFDLVGMLVDDLVVCGAEPLFLTDYIATGRVVPERIAAIVKGIAEACVAAGCALVGGETAEHPGLLGPDEYDVAGSTTGVVEASQLLGPGRVRPGDVVVAMASSGLHSNGYSLVRHVLCSERGRGAAAGRARRRPRPHPRRGAARADPDLRQGLPRPGPGHRDPRHVPHHRRRPGRQPRAGAARRADAPRIDRATWSLPPDLLAGRRDRRRGPRGPRADPELRRRDGLAHRGRRRRPGGGRCWPATASTAWVAGTVSAAGGRTTRAASLLHGDHRYAEPADPALSSAGRRAGITTGRLGLAHEQLTQTGSASAPPAIRARGSTQWGAAVQRRSRPRLPAT